jgi:hypothetical protein
MQQSDRLAGHTRRSMQPCGAFFLVRGLHPVLGRRHRTARGRDDFSREVKVVDCHWTDSIDAVQLPSLRPAAGQFRGFQLDHCHRLL